MSTLYLILITVIGVFVYQTVFDPLRAVPGPFLARFTRLWELHQVRKGRFELLNIKLHEKYGPIVRLAPGRYSINDVEATKTIMGHASKFPKSSFYYAFGNTHPELSDLFSERDIQRHGQKRRRVASLYSMTSLLSFEQFVDNQNTVLCQKLEHLASTQIVLDVFKWMQFYAFDVIGEITIGEPFGMMKAGHDELGILKAIHDGLVYGSQVGLLSEVHYFLGMLTRALRMKIPFDVVLAFIDHNIKKRQQGESASTRQDFLSKLLQLQDAGKVQHLDVVTAIGANIAAGSDTTAISISNLVDLLASHPACLSRLRHEIDEYQASSKISNPVTYQEALAMPYLQAVIKESLRLRPATGQPLARVLPHGGANLCGQYFPAGSVVAVHPWVLHRNAAIYGPDGDQFIPERWLGPPEVISKLESAFLSFGAGARTCIGKNISLLEMSKLIPQIYRQFDLIPCGPKTTVQSDWFVKPIFTMRVALRSDLD